jgi:hypothetical protein
MDVVILGKALTLSALVAACTEYAVLIRRRADRREDAEAAARADSDAALRGLVRMAANDDARRAERLRR